MQKQTHESAYIIGGSLAVIVVVICIFIWYGLYVGFGGALWPGQGMNKYAAQLFEYPLPPQTELLEKHRIHDRLHEGNGGANYVAVMLVRSELT